MRIQTLITTLLFPIWVSPTPVDRPAEQGHFVPFAELNSCPDLPSRSKPPQSVQDVRPDDISVVMALGDSITAGFLARTSPQNTSPSNQYSRGQTQDTMGYIPIIPIAREYRGLSYPIGGDDGAITIPNILSRWSPKLKGMSRGYHIPLACIWGRCLYRDKEDGLNAAVSGSTASNLVAQVEDALLPRLSAMKIDEKAWKFVNIGIGGNDICAFCLSPNISSIPLTGTPKDFARGIKDAVELLRAHVPNLIVNIIGLFKVSSLYNLTLKDPYCRGPFLPPVPHLPLECSCALLPGPAGDYTRQKMDELGEAYDEAVKDLINEWEDENDPRFGVTWQPGSAVDLEHWPIEALSPVDCFHPSELAHQRVAAGFWNRLTLDIEDKARPIKWADEVLVRCLEEGDRIKIGVRGRE